MKPLANKVAIVTGGSRGIGAVISKSLARAGARVAVNYHALREAARRLADGGRIVNLSSSTTRLILPTYSAYVATKAAVEQLTRIFAKEIGPRGMRRRLSA